jgi:hypothetical protein
MLKKTLAAGTIAVMLAGASIAFAAQGTREHRAWRPNAEDAAAFTDARIAGLKAGLKLTAEQEKNWPAVETAIRELAQQRAEHAKQRAERRTERREARRNGGDKAPRHRDMIARLRQGADAMSDRAAGMKKLADASEPLYQSLDDGQKRRFGMLLRMGARGKAGHHHRHHWQRRADNDRGNGGSGMNPEHRN